MKRFRHFSVLPAIAACAACLVPATGLADCISDLFAAADENCSSLCESENRYCDDCYSEHLGSNFGGTCVTGTVCYNESCQVADCPACTDNISETTYEFYISPVSLIWNDLADLNKDPQIVKFPLDPTSKNSWYIWKASADTPLLVYDPEHLGKITDSKQLFGNYTFGGKPDGKPWEDGFKALATLDKDQDGKIVGAELAPIGVWFDRNRNGVSEAGEVQTSAEAKIKLIYYRLVRRDNETKDLFIQYGYTRQAEKELNFAIVDWMSKGAASKELLAAEVTRLKQISEARSKQARAKVALKPAGSKAKLAQNRYSVNGVWKWQTDSNLVQSKSFKPGGYLVFNDDRSGEIKGHSYSRAPVNFELMHVFGYLFVALEGAKELLPDGRMRIVFAVPPRPYEDQDQIIKSVAYLSKDGRTLTGETFARFREKDKPDVQPYEVSYSWEAVRTSK